MDRAVRWTSARAHRQDDGHERAHITPSARPIPRAPGNPCAPPQSRYHPAVLRSASWVVLVSLSTGCGARTELLVEDSDAPPPSPPENACTSAVSGATPMRGYCSTRAHLAPHATPSAPVRGWVSALPTDFQPIEVLVDERGRVYATIDPISGDTAVVPKMLVVVDADGALIARHDFRPDSVGNLFVASDGGLRATVGVSPRRLVRVDETGEVTPLATLPPNTFRFAVASDGSLVATTTDFSSPDHIVRVSPDGAVLFTSPPLGEGASSVIALEPNDDAVIATLTADAGTTVRRLDERGAFAWERHVDGILTEGPAIAPDGSVRVVTGVSDAAMVPTTIVTALTEEGEPLWETRLDEDYQQTWENALVVGADGATFVHTFQALIALAPDGGVRWRIDAPANLSYDAVVDTGGTLVALLGPVRAISAATGDELWRVEGPDPVGGTFFYASNLALRPHGCLVGASHGGELFSACDP